MDDCTLDGWNVRADSIGFQFAVYAHTAHFAADGTAIAEQAVNAILFVVNAVVFVINPSFVHPFLVELFDFLYVVYAESFVLEMSLVFAHKTIEEIFLFMHRLAA